jgi:Ecdysteroid kinase-like family
LAHAGFHAFWWDHERLGVSVGTFADESGHGDAHAWNALVPRDPTSNDVRLIDWDAWRIDTATDDLAYMIAVHWFPDWRRRYEQESLRRYHDALVAGGVRRYFFDALCEDDRHSVLWQIATPMWQANHGLGPWIWWHHLDRIMSGARPRLSGAARLALNHSPRSRRTIPSAYGAPSSSCDSIRSSS